MDRRTLARELTMQALYQLDIQGEEAFAYIDNFLRENSDDDMVLQLAKEWIKGVWENLSVCDQLLQTAAVKWQMSRLSLVDKGILRLSIYHLKFCPDIPPKVVINEAIEMAKKYSSESAPSFINGVLDAVLKKTMFKSSCGEVKA